jgi:tetratricopeptide (TPR) repeat protein
LCEVLWENALSRLRAGRTFLSTGGSVNRLFWVVIVGCPCWAQTEALTPRQANDRFLADLRGDSVVRTCTPGKGQPPVVCTTNPYGIDPPEIPQEKPSGQTISVEHLGHRIPKEAAREFHHAVKLSRAGEHEKAAAELELAVHRDPELASAENQLGVEYAYLRRWEEAEMAFRRSVEVEPAWWMGHYNLALTLYGRGDLSGAEQSTRRALVFSSENPRIRLLLGELLVMQEETQAEGITELRFAARTMGVARRVLRDLGVR